jgi:hypothetical protein
MMSTRNLSEFARWSVKVDRPPDEAECWEWVGAKNARGYGRFRYDGENRYAHRWAWEWYIGPPTEGQVLDHTCCNPSCVNPAHLQQVTQVENASLGGSRRGRTCPHGHPFTEENTYRDRRGWKQCRVCRSQRR